MICSYNKSQQDAIYLNFILVKNLRVSDRLTAHHQESYYCIHSNLYLSYSYVDCVLARSGIPSQPRQQTVNITSTTNTSCCEYGIKNPDDGQ
jgi:hypothetical protein